MGEGKEIQNIADKILGYLYHVNFLEILRNKLETGDKDSYMKI